MTQLFTLKKTAILSLLILLPACGTNYEVRTAYKQLHNGCVYQELHGVMEESLFGDDDFYLQKKYIYEYPNTSCSTIIQSDLNHGTRKVVNEDRIPLNLLGGREIDVRK